MALNKYSCFSNKHVNGLKINISCVEIQKGALDRTEEANFIKFSLEEREKDVKKLNQRIEEMDEAYQDLESSVEEKIAQVLKCSFFTAASA